MSYFNVFKKAFKLGLIWIYDMCIKCVGTWNNMDFSFGSMVTKCYRVVWLRMVQLPKRLWLGRLGRWREKHQTWNLENLDASKVSRIWCEVYLREAQSDHGLVGERWRMTWWAYGTNDLNEVDLREIKSIDNVEDIEAWEIMRWIVILAFRQVHCQRWCV